VASTFVRLFVAGTVFGAGGLALAQGDPKSAQAPPDSPGFRASQVTLAILQMDGRARKFRATVMGRKDDVLTILTAAHCFSADDADLKVRMVLDGEEIPGTVVSVARNPAYRPNADREVPGADNAVARLRFNPRTSHGTESFQGLKPVVGLASRLYPGPGGQTVSVRMIDQYGVEHAVKAGNYSNPRLLEWGLAYKPIPGDSGSGVFVMSRSSDGRPSRPVLIGVISSNDARGGMASLVSLEMPWIADEIAR
jgi:hypothetical protein